MESSPDLLTDESRFFLEPASPAHRQYEALRAYFLEGSPSQQVAERFGYSPGSFRVILHHHATRKSGLRRHHHVAAYAAIMAYMYHVVQLSAFADHRDTQGGPVDTRICPDLHKVADLDAAHLR